jgi:hypothetical protein
MVMLGGVAIARRVAPHRPVDETVGPATLAWIREQRSIHPTRNRTTRFSELIARLAARPAYA